MLDQQLILIFSLIFIISLSYIDFRNHILPNKLVFAFLIYSLFSIPAAKNFSFERFYFSILYASLVFILYLFIFIISKNSFGFGDVKYSFVMSIIPSYFFGFWPNLNIHIYAFLIAGIYAAFLIFVKKYKKNHVIAFGPFMSCSYFLFVVLSI